MLNYQRVLIDMTCAVVVGTILCRFERSNRSWWDLAPLQPFSHRLKNCKKGASRLRAHAWFVPVSPVLHDWLEVTPANMGGQPAQILYIYVQYVWNQHYSTTSGSKKKNESAQNQWLQASTGNVLWASNMWNVLRFLHKTYKVCTIFTFGQRKGHPQRPRRVRCVWGGGVSPERSGSVLPATVKAAMKFRRALRKQSSRWALEL